MSIRVLMTARTAEETTVKDETRMWVESSMTFEAAHQGARRLFHIVENIPTTATWEVEGGNLWPIDPGDVRTAGQLPDMYEGRP